MSQNMTAVPDDEFFVACRKGKADVVSAYLDSGADPSARDEYRFTGLICAGRNGHLQVAQLLLGRGADMEAGDIRGRTALFHAATYKRYDLVEFLAKFGANVNPVDSHGWTPLDFSIMSSHKKMARLLESLGGLGRYTKQ